MKNQFEILCERLMSGMVSESYFFDELTEYIKEVYINTIAENVKTKKQEVLNMPSQNELEEMSERIMECISDGAYAFMRSQDKNLVREFNDQDIESYDEFYCEEQKFDLGRVTDQRVRKAMNFVLGLDSKTVFLQIATKKTNGSNSEVNLLTTAVPEYNNINRYDRRGRNQGLYGRCYEDSICCSRFDASHMETRNTNGAKMPNHENFIERVQLDEVEKQLYEHYFKKYSPCPHFHYYRKQVCWDRFSNDYSFAININNLAEYLKDLENAVNKGDKSNPLLTYSLGMPFLAIAKGEITCDISPFITTARNILLKYDTKTKKDDIIYELYDDLLRTRSMRYQKNPVGQISSAINFMCGVSNNPIETVVSVPSGRFLERYTEVDQRKTEATLVGLAARFQESIGETLDEKKLNIKKRNWEDEDNDQKNQ